MGSSPTPRTFLPITREYNNEESSLNGLKYKCPLCNYEANQPIELVRHAGEEHGLELYKGKHKSAFDE